LARALNDHLAPWHNPMFQAAPAINRSVFLTSKTLKTDLDLYWLSSAKTVKMEYYSIKNKWIVAATLL
jgi:hypothetical protein